MATVKVDQLEANDKATLACTYASLILHDLELEIDATKIQKLLKASNVKLENFWPKIFAKSLANKNMSDLLTVGSGGAPSGPVSTPQQAAQTDAKPAGKAPKVEEPEEDGNFEDFGNMFE